MWESSLAAFRVSGLFFKLIILLLQLTHNTNNPRELNPPDSDGWFKETTPDVKVFVMTEGFLLSSSVTLSCSL